MNLKKRFLPVSFGVVIFLLGLVIGRFWKDFYLFKWSGEVKIIDILNFFLVLGIGLWVPFILQKSIDDNRDIKAFLVEELKHILATLTGIKKIISEAYSSGVIESKDKDQINLIFHLAEQEVGSFSEQMKVSFPNIAARLEQQLITLLRNYKDFVTGGELMISTFTVVDANFYRQHSSEYSTIETGIKTTINKIYKL